MYCSLWFFQARWALFSYFAPKMHHFIAKLKQLECFLHRYLSWTHNADLLTVTLLVDGFPNRANLLFCLQVVRRFRHPPGARGFLLVHQLYHQCCQHSPRCSHGANGPGPHTQRDEMLTWRKWKTRPTNSMGRRSVSSVRRNQKFVSFSTSANCQLSSSTKSRSAHVGSLIQALTPSPPPYFFLCVNCRLCHAMVRPGSLPKEATVWDSASRARGFMTWCFGKTQSEFTMVWVWILK